MTLENWRDLAVVLLVIEAFFISLVPGVILFFAVRGMLWVIRKLRHLAPQAQGYFRKAAAIAEQTSQRIAAPVIGVSATMAQARRWRSILISSVLSKREV